MLALRLQKQPDGTWVSSSSECQAIAKPTITPALVTQQAVRLIPKAPIGFAPKANTLVNMQTIMWVDAPKTQTLPAAKILGKTVRITITLDHISWTFGDGHTDTTSNPGKPYDKTYDSCSTKLCSHYYGHVYEDTGTNTVTATAAWQARFTVDGAKPTNIPGTIDGPHATSTITVRQARAVLVDNPHD